MILVKVTRKSTNNKVVSVSVVGGSETSGFVSKAVGNSIKHLQRKSRTCRCYGRNVHMVLRPSSPAQIEAELLIRNIRLLAEKFREELRVRRRFV